MITSNNITVLKIEEKILKRLRVLIVLPKIYDSLSDNESKARFLDICRNEKSKTLSELNNLSRQLYVLGVSKNEIESLINSVYSKDSHEF